MRRGPRKAIAIRLAAIASLLAAGLATEAVITSDIRLPGPATPAVSDELVPRVRIVPPAAASDDAPTERRPSRPARRPGPRTVASLTTRATCSRWLRAALPVRQKFAAWAGWPRRAHAAERVLTARCRAARNAGRAQSRPASPEFLRAVARRLTRARRHAARRAADRRIAGRRGARPGPSTAPGRPPAAPRSPAGARDPAAGRVERKVRGPAPAPGPSAPPEADGRAEPAADPAPEPAVAPGRESASEPMAEPDPDADGL